MPVSEIFDAELRRNYLFSSLGDQQFAHVKHNMHILRLDEGQHLFDHGQKAERFFMVHSGQVKLFRLSLDGIEKVIDIVQPGQSFAEAVMFMKSQNYPVSAQSINACEVFSFDSRNYVQLLGDSIDSCFHLLGDMSMRLHMLLNDIDHLTLQNATYRLISYIAKQIPEGSGSASVEIELSTPKNIIASRLSIQPETFSRILKNLAKDGIINVHGKYVEIHDVQRLKEFE